MILTVPDIYNTRLAFALRRREQRLWAETRSDPFEIQRRIRAQSILCGQRYRDGTTNPGTLSIEQALDVLHWACDPLAYQRRYGSAA